MSYKYSRKVSYCIAGTIFDPPWLWQRILYIQLGTAAESTDLRHLQRLQCFSLAKCLGLCRSCDQCWGGSQASVGPYGLKLELHGTLAIVFVNTESTWTWSPFYQLWHFIPNSWLPLAKIVSATLVIHSHETALLKPDPIWPPLSRVSTCFNYLECSRSGSCVQYAIPNVQNSSWTGGPCFEAHVSYTIQRRGHSCKEGGGLKMLRLELEWKFPSLAAQLFAWRRSKPKKIDTRFHQWGANYAAEK